MTWVLVLLGVYSFGVVVGYSVRVVLERAQEAKRREAKLDELWTGIQTTVALQAKLGSRIRLLRPLWFRMKVGRN